VDGRSDGGGMDGDDCGNAEIKDATVALANGNTMG
jgi:hypothetical protein